MLALRYVPSALVAITLASWAWTQTFGPLMALGLTALFGAVVLGRQSFGPWPAMLGVGVLVASTVLAIPFANTGFGRPDAAAFMAMWTAFMAMLYLVDHHERTLWHLVPAALLLAGLLVWQRLHGIPQAYGGPMGPNPAGGMLALGVAFLLPTRARWMVLPLLVGLACTGSRSALLAAAVAIGAWLLMGGVSRRALVRLAVVGGLVAVVTLPWLLNGFTRADARQGMSVWSWYRLDAQNRFSVPSGDDGHPLWPSLLPRGPAGTFIGLHNIPLRMAYEQGIIAAATWIALTAWALWRRPRGTSAWYMMLVFTVIAMVDYYPMMPLVTSAFWWVLLSMRLKLHCRARTADTGESPPGSAMTR